MKRAIQFATGSVLGAGCLLASAAGLVQVDDDQLSDVNGQDGVYLNLKGFSLNSAAHFGYAPLTLTYTMPYEGNPLDQVNDPGDPLGKDPSKPVSYIQYSGFSISRTDPATEAEIFSDPYQIQVETVIVPDEIALPPGLAADDRLLTHREQQVIRLLNPKNLSGSVKWNVTYDWKVAEGVTSTSTGVVHDMGAHIVEDMVIRGGGISLAPAWSYQNNEDVRGAAFGLDLNVEIGALILRPRGRGDVDTFDAQGVMTHAGTEMALRGIKIGAANATKTGVDTDPTKTWKVADVITQPGIINAYTDANGKPVLRMGIEWYRGSDENQIPTGAMSVDQIIIKGGTAAAPTSTNFGGLSIGGMQIRYLDVVFRNPY